jgi:hypothetical protein
MSSDGPAVAVHEHTFPHTPPFSILHPGPCECGKTNEQDEADRFLQMALTWIERAYGVPPRTSTQWATHYGSQNFNDGTGYVEPRDDVEAARQSAAYFEDGQTVQRTVIALRWELAPAEETAP